MQHNRLFHSKLCWQDKTDIGLAQSVEPFTVERKVVGLISGAGPLLRVRYSLCNASSKTFVWLG